MTHDQGNGWGEYKRLILDTMRRLEEIHDEHEERDEVRFSKINETLASIRADIASLKVRSGVWGAVAGAIPAIVVLVWWLLGSRP